MKCQILFSGKNKKTIINLLSAEFVQRVVQFKQCTAIKSIAINVITFQRAIGSVNDSTSDKSGIKIGHKGRKSTLCVSSSQINLCIWAVSLQKHAYLNILKTPPKTESFQIKILKFLYFCSKHRLWVLVRTASLRQF